MAPPPTFVIDFLYLGWPMGTVAGVCLALAVVGVFVVLRRKGLHIGLNIALCVVLFAAANFSLYVVALNKANEARLERIRKKDETPLSPPAPNKTDEPLDISKPPRI
jgi:high-affinity Fe2+/Pb2+ permease